MRYIYLLYCLTPVAFTEHEAVAVRQLQRLMAVVIASFMIAVTSF